MTFCTFKIICFTDLQKLLDRFDYDDEPEGGEDAKKDDSTPFPASQSL